MVSGTFVISPLADRHVGFYVDHVSMLVDPYYIEGNFVFFIQKVQ